MGQATAGASHLVEYGVEQFNDLLYAPAKAMLSEKQGGLLALSLGGKALYEAFFKAPLPPVVAPASASLGTTGGCAGGTVSTSFGIVAPPGMTWTIAWTGLPAFIGDHQVTPTTGSGPGTVTFRATLLPQKPTPGFTCSDTLTFNYGDSVAIFFSNGDTVYFSVNYDYLSVI